MALIGGAVLLITDGDGSGEGSTAEEVELAQAINNRSQGLRAAYPEDWKRSARQGVVVLESPDGCVTISLSSPGAAEDAGQIRRAAIARVRRTWDQTRLRRLPEATSDGQTTSGAVIAGRPKGGEAGVVRLTVTEASRLSHLTSAFFMRPPCEEAIPAVEAILSSIEYTR